MIEQALVNLVQPRDLIGANVLSIGKLMSDWEIPQELAYQFGDVGRYFMYIGAWVTVTAVELCSFLGKTHQDTAGPRGFRQDVPETEVLAALRSMREHEMLSEPNRDVFVISEKMIGYFWYVLYGR